MRSSGFVLGLLMLCGGCHKSKPDSGETGGHGDPVPAACDRYNTLGGFDLQAQATWAGFGGALPEGPSPWILDALVEEGDCVLYGWEHTPACEPACENGEVCGFGDACHAWPGYLAIGTLTLEGLWQTVVLEPTEFGAYYSTDSWTDPYVPGDSITMTAAGSAAVDGFTLQVSGVESLPESGPSFVMRPHEALRLAWQPALVPAARMQVTLSIDHHASTPGYAVCDAPDAQGQVTVSATIVDGLIQAGSSGIGTYVENMTFVRYDAGYAEIEVGGEPCCTLFRSSTSQSGEVETVL